MCPGSCPRAPMASAEPPCSQNRGNSVLLQIVVVLILLPTIAFASPPDPSWITGIYDDADGDDGVFLDYQPIAAVAVSQQPFLSPPYLSERFLVSGLRGVDGVPAVQFARGPPLSLTSIFCTDPSRLQPCARPRASCIV